MKKNLVDLSGQLSILSRLLDELVEGSKRVQLELSLPPNSAPND
jgi:hypothetical protein